MRTVISLLIVVHGFLAGVAVFSNFEPAVWQVRILSSFRGYTRLLNFDLNFTPYHLTHATEMDVDHRVEVLPQGESEWIGLPASHFRGGDGYKRIQRLAFVWAFQAQYEGQPALFAQAVGTHFARQRSIIPQQVRCRRHFLQSPDDLIQGTPARRNPDDVSFFATVYAANTIVGDTGYVDVVRVDDASQVAQPTRGSDSVRGPNDNEPNR